MVKTRTTELTIHGCVRSVHQSTSGSCQLGHSGTKNIALVRELACSTCCRDASKCTHAHTHTHWDHTLDSTYWWIMVHIMMTHDERNADSFKARYYSQELLLYGNKSLWPGEVSSSMFGSTSVHISCKEVASASIETPAFIWIIVSKSFLGCKEKRQTSQDEWLGWWDQGTKQHAVHQSNLQKMIGLAVAYGMPLSANIYTSYFLTYSHTFLFLCISMYHPTTPSHVTSTTLHLSLHWKVRWQAVRLLRHGVQELRGGSVQGPKSRRQGTG